MASLAPWRPSAERSLLSCCAVGLALVLTLLQRERAKLKLAQEAAERQRQLRDEERKGRVRAERQLREAAVGGGGAGDAAGEAGVAPGGNGFVFNPIGTFRSCYRNRAGTPRQGGIVGESLAVLQCVKDLNPTAALEGFAEFSHCWVLYVFHENTNLQREGKTLARRKQTKGRIPLWQGLCMKVAPPRCPELRVGVLSCRTPHRPNPIGLSLARIVKVDTKRNEVILAGLDVVDGTPCLDLKPYLPGFESMPSARVPAWVQASHEEPLMRVDWSPAAREAFATLFGEAGGAEEEGARPAGVRFAGRRLELRPFASSEALVRALEGTLALDIRSPHQKDRHKNPGAAQAASGTPFFEGDLWFHELHVLYAMLPELHQPGGAAAWVRIDSVEPRPQEEP